jgi:hypothetical protein
MAARASRDMRFSIDENLNFVGDRVIAQRRRGAKFIAVKRVRVELAEALIRL